MPWSALLRLQADSKRKRGDEEDKHLQRKYVSWSLLVLYEAGSVLLTGTATN
jgi:hypothetical protein